MFCMLPYGHITATLYVLPFAVCFLLWTLTLGLWNQNTSEFPHTLRTDKSYYAPEPGKDNSPPPLPELNYRQRSLLGYAR